MIIPNELAVGTFYCKKVKTLKKESIKSGMTGSSSLAAAVPVLKNRNFTFNTF